MLGIETSCDETSAAVLRGGRGAVAGHLLPTDLHARYGELSRSWPAALT